MTRLGIALILTLLAISPATAGDLRAGAASVKITPDVYRAVIDEAHKQGLRLFVHYFYLDDAKDLLRSGADLLAHSVRDKPIDNELISLLKEHNVPYCATLTRELSTFVYEPIRWNQRFGWRPLCAQERLGYFHFWRQVGRRMNIRDVPADYDAFECYNREYERKHFRFTEANARVV